MAVEQGWQRRFAFIDLTSKEIEQLIQPYAAGAQVLEATPLSGGLRNSNYRVRLAEQATPVVLRLYSADPSACRRETALISLVEAHVPVPRVLHAEPDAEPPWAVVTWVDGVRFDQFMRTASHAQIEHATSSAGRVLAAIHAHAFPRPGFLGPDLGFEADLGPDTGWSGMLEHWLGHGRSGARLGADLTRRLLGFIADNAAGLNALSVQASLVHADYKPWNLLLDEHNEIAGVLDWEFAFSGPPLNDIGIFLRHDARLPAAYRAGFVNGYRDAGGDLPADWPRLARVVDLISLCYFLERPEEDPAVVRDVRPLIETTLQEFGP